MSNYQTVLVAYVIEADSIKEAHDLMYEKGITPNPDVVDHHVGETSTYLHEWWIAEDDTFSVNGGNEAAVFVPTGMSQVEARGLLENVARISEGMWNR